MPPIRVVAEASAAAKFFSASWAWVRARPCCWIECAVEFLPFGDGLRAALQGAGDRLGAGLRRRPQQRSEVLRVGVVAFGELREHIGAIEGPRQRQHRLLLRFARPNDAAAPKVHARNRARLGQTGNEPGAHQRGLARAAHPEHQQERPAARAGVDQALAQLLDHACAAEEHRRVRLVERLQAAKRRALDGDRPGVGAGRKRILAFKPLANVALDLRLELVGAGEAVTTGGEVTALRLKPILPELLQCRELRGLLVELTVFEQHRRGLAVNQDVGRAVLASGDDRLLELVFAAGGHAAVRPPVLVRKLAAEPLPEDADHQVGLRRRGIWSWKVSAAE
jgi:hypothetical protein